MGKNRVIWGLLLAAALGLYLFDNGTGTRLLLASVILTPMCSGLALWLLGAKLNVRLLLPEEALPGEPFRGVLILKSRGRIPAARASCRVELIHVLTGERIMTTINRPLGPGGTAEVLLTCSAARSGELEVKVTRLRAADAFGLFTRRLSGEAAARVTICPRLVPSSEEREAEPSLDASEYSTRRAGADPSETFQIREYVPGDSIRQIHWKLSQKTGRLLVRELGLPVEPTMGRAYEPDKGSPSCTLGPEPEEGRFGRLWRAGLAAALYAALAGLLCQLAGTGAAVIPALLPGAALAAALPLLPQKRRRWLLPVLLAVTALWRLFLGQTALDGEKLLLNGLFDASERRQAYVYEKFAVSAPEDEWMACLQAALLPLGLALGGALGWCLSWRRRWPLVILPAVTAAGLAYLGAPPGAGWCVLLALGLTAALTGGVRWNWRGLALGTAAIVCALVLLVFPGEDPALAAWEDGARDALALYTTIQTPLPEDEPEEQPDAPEEPPLFQPENAPVDWGGGLLDWARPLSGFLILLLLAIVLFAPSIASDRLKKRRAKNRAGLDDPDNAAAIRAAFLYSLRWFRLGGVTPDNVPFSRYALRIGEALSPRLRQRFEEMLPLWQEAAYSAHTMDTAQREAMLAFLEEARQAVWERLGRRQRFLAKYVEAL